MSIAASDLTVHISEIFYDGFCEELLDAFEFDLTKALNRVLSAELYCELGGGLRYALNDGPNEWLRDSFYDNLNMHYEPIEYQT